MSFTTFKGSAVKPTLLHAAQYWVKLPRESEWEVARYHPGNDRWTIQHWDDYVRTDYIEFIDIRPIKRLP